MFLEPIDGIRLGEREAAPVVEHRRMMTMSVLAFVEHGDQNNLETDSALTDLRIYTSIRQPTSIKQRPTRPPPVSRIGVVGLGRNLCLLRSES
jgi:hypothetical protein